MALLDALKQNKGVAKKKDAASKKKTTPGKGVSDNAGVLYTILKRPHVSEKATMFAERGVYVFEVHKDANKTKIREALQMIYSVTPEKIRITNNPAKNVLSRGRRGVKSGKKKAVIYLKKGDKIDVV